MSALNPSKAQKAPILAQAVISVFFQHTITKSRVNHWKKMNWLELVKNNVVRAKTGKKFPTHFIRSRLVLGKSMQSDIIGYGTCVFSCWTDTV